MQIIIDQKLVDNVEYFNYFGNMVRNDARSTREIKSSFAMAKNTIQEEEDSFHHKIGLKFKQETSKMLNLEHNIVWC